MNTTFTNGKLLLGAPESPIDVMIAYGGHAGQSKCTVTMGENTQFEAYIRDLKLGQGTTSNGVGDGVLDLRQSTIVGGKVAVRNLLIGEGGTHNEAALRVGAASGLSAIEVENRFSVCYGHAIFTGYVGDPDNGRKLPDNVNIKIGTDAAARGSLTVGRCYYAGGDAYLLAGNGGTFTAWLTDLIVAQHDGSYSTPLNGTFDIRNMASCTIDATNIVIGMSTTGRTTTGTAYLPAGTVTADKVSVGDTNTSTTGLLQLEGTTVSVATQAYVGLGDKIVTNVHGTSCGLDLADAAAIVASDNGLVHGAINIVFDAPAGSGIYYGLRWAGDHTVELEWLADNQNLTWDDTALPEPASIFTSGGYTYVGVEIAMAKVTAFTVADATSGSSLITNAAGVTVAIAGEPAPDQTVVGYAVNETGIEPGSADWRTTLDSYTIQSPSGGDVVLYGWVKDSAGNTASATATIYYDSAVPVITAGPVVTNNGDGTATMTWTTDIPALGSAQYGVVRLSGAIPSSAEETSVDTSHSLVLTGIAAGTNYKIVVTNTEVASPAFYWPSMWPIPCDVNHDCKVNILDLISIRNKLNQPVSGDNILADVNLPTPDGKINILDLIAVRNKLNTQCP